MQPGEAMSAKGFVPPWAVRVCLVISSFRNDKEIERILGAIHAEGDSPFHRVIIVDSLGTDHTPGLLAEKRWPRVEYHSFDRNLGSAGNLAERLRLAAATGADYAYAINHDGDARPEVIAKLVACAAEHSRVGAVYPLRRMAARQGEYDLSGTHTMPFRRRVFARPPDRRLLDVYWGSSNGALYSLEPIRRGLKPREELWMGWEDLAYGWLLHASGYEQFIVTDAITEDSYEFRAHRVGPFVLHVSDKPAWYAYYQVRNLILVARETDHSLASKSIVVARILLEFGLTTTVRPQKLLRWKLLSQGLIDGLRGVTGKGEFP